jgi:hypothetical protein
MPRITISYRRDDSGVITGRIFDRLAAHYGRDAVFRDIDNIPPGTDFREQIAKVLDESDMLLAIVGPRWLGARGGHTRLSDESDPVRLEIETGLRKRMPVIPVLVLRATMPRITQLPDSIKDFAYRQAVQVDAGEDFDVHSARLIRAMDRILRQNDGGAADLSRIIDEAPKPSEAGVATTALAEPADAVDLADIGLVPSVEAAETVAREELPIADGTLAGDRIFDPPPRWRGRRMGLFVSVGAVSVIIVAAVIVFLKPSLPPDVMALAAAKDAAETKALVLQAELTASQKKAESLQSSLDSAQTEAGKREKQLATLQAGSDQAAKDLAIQKEAAAAAQTQIDQLTTQVRSLGDQATRASNAEANQKELATQLAATEDRLKDAQNSLDQQAAQLKDAQARADKAEKDRQQLAGDRDSSATARTLVEQQLSEANARADQAVKNLATQKDAVAKAQAQVNAFQAQVKTLSDELTTEQQRRATAETLVSQLGDQVASLQRNQGSPAPIASQGTSSTGPQPGSDDSTWSTAQRREAQHDLVTLGHLQGASDGNFGPTSRTAIKQFQAFVGDQESGVMTDAEARSLHDMAQRIATQIARGETSPGGLAASAIQGADLRYQRAWTAEKGSTEKPDPREAVYWYGLAAADGDAKAFTNLGVLLARGQGLQKPDPEAAALLWWAAAARGERTAMFNLGALWENGIGVAADLVKAKTWYQRAAAKGDPEAQAALKRLGA